MVIGIVQKYKMLASFESLLSILEIETKLEIPNEETPNKIGAAISRRKFSIAKFVTETSVKPHFRTVVSVCFSKVMRLYFCSSVCHLMFKQTESCPIFESLHENLSKYETDVQFL